MKTLLIALALAAAAHAEPVAILSHTIASGGGRVTSANVSIVAEVGTLGGVVAESPSNVVVARQGFAGRLYDEAAFSISAGVQFVAENGTLQATALVTTDDNLFAPVPGSAVTWFFTNATGQAIVDAAGLISGQPVYESAVLNLRGEYHGLHADVGVSVLDTLPDNFGLYAGDTVPDAWQVLHFGTADPFGVGTVDFDSDGQNNAFEYTAGTAPRDNTSVFRVTPFLAGVTFGPCDNGATYVVEFSATLAAGSWAPLTNSTTQPNPDGTRTVTDLDGITARRFYRVNISR